VRLAFLQKFHRLTASSCQRCLWAVSALLKACELFKEKLLFCSRISAAAKNKSQHIHASDHRGLRFLTCCGALPPVRAASIHESAPVVTRSTKGN
jgi:hypothetical protein